MTEHFDAVVVGSGFGGSVSAYRLAEAGKRVCLLERGKAYPPGSFPRIPRELARNVWDPSAGLHGMFDIWTFKGIEALVSSALGGGSIIYANVLIRKDPEWFVEPDGRPWLVSRAELDPHYEKVERVLAPQTYPLEVAPYSRTQKTLAMQRAADGLGLDWALPNLAVTFANPGRPPVPGEPIEEEDNLHHRRRYTCRLCGECDIGCNFGSKNTLDFNYLTLFENHGGEIRTRSEVRRFAPRPGGGFTVEYVQHEPESEGRKTDTSALPLRTMTADRLVLAAGSLGSPYLLLKNRESFPALSKALGSRWCGNGDLLAFLTKAPTPLDPDVGPVITSRIRYDGEDGRGYYIEDGGYPTLVSWLLEASQAPASARRAWRFLSRFLRNRLTGRPVSNLSAELAQLLGECKTSSGALPLLGMGRDVPDGNLSLSGDYLQCDWTIKTSRRYYESVKRSMEDLAGALDAKFSSQPLWYFRRVATVHPVGGCPLGRNADEGVVDRYGQVFGYPGLSVADGSVMPGPVGPNPSLTIAALADRFAEWTIENWRPRT
ncbi:MAG: FAD-dependent oxidoreductase [Thermoleophilia bacterium]|nr:FAD-dependent oxidoreductase [Thermoleophilia bacterium]